MNDMWLPLSTSEKEECFGVGVIEGSQGSLTCDDKWYFSVEFI